jgi:hypothetical protein
MNAHKFPAGRPTGTIGANAADRPKGERPNPTEAADAPNRLTYQPTADGAILTAPAGSMSPAEFLRRSMAVFAPTPTRESERADAARIYIGKVFAGEDAATARAEMHARFEEIEERYLHRTIMGKAQVML